MDVLTFEHEIVWCQNALRYIDAVSLLISYPFSFKVGGAEGVFLPRCLAYEGLVNHHAKDLSLVAGALSLDADAQRTLVAIDHQVDC